MNRSKFLGRRQARHALAAMHRLAPGVYDDGRGAVHVSARELLAHLGFPYTPDNEDALAAALRDVAAQFGIPNTHEVIVLDD